MSSLYSTKAIQWHSFTHLNSVIHSSRQRTFSAPLLFFHVSKVELLTYPDAVPQWTVSLTAVNKGWLWLKRQAITRWVVWSLAAVYVSSSWVKYWTSWVRPACHDSPAAGMILSENERRRSSSEFMQLPARPLVLFHIEFAGVPLQQWWIKWILI